MPRRPKLWIHRTRRFWVGLGGGLWAIFWITRMVRAERRELKKFSEAPPKTDREL